MQEAESIESLFNEKLNDVRIKGKQLRIQRDRALSLKNRALTLADKVTNWSAFVQGEEYSDLRQSRVAFFCYILYVVVCCRVGQEVLIQRDFVQIDHLSD